MPAIINRSPDLDLNKEGWLTKSELAAVLDVCVGTVDNWTRCGLLPPPVRVTQRCVRWSRSAIRQFMEAVSAGATPTAAQLHATKEAVS
jgi:predicted DNA-binding transcriptional regulator AlpA